MRALPENVVGHSPDVAEMTRELRQFLYENMYYHPHVMRMQAKAGRVLAALFAAYVKESRQLPREEQAKLAARSLERVVCDYIAGMTDRFALQEYAKMFDSLTPV